MPFELKNAGATYQRMMTTMFERQIGKTVEVYIDDMLVKNVRKEDHLAHLREVFEILRMDELRLNASKCLFGVHSGKFLGHIIRMIAALGRFSSWSTSSLGQLISAALSFDCWGRKGSFLWDEDCSAAFQGIKSYLSSPPCLSIPSPGEPLYLYLAVSEHACSDFSGRITRWGVQLGSLGVEYKLRTSIKGQVLADFVAEFQGKDLELGSTNSLGLETNLVPTEWKLFVDGASNAMGSGAGAVLISPEGLILEQAVRLNFLASNNESEYEALLIGLKCARRLGADRLRVEQIGREHNSHADILAKLATAMETDMQRTVTVEVLNSPSSQDFDSDILCIISPVASWMDPFIAYLQNGQLPEDQKEADIVKRKAPGYWLSKEGSIYKRSFSGSYLLCVHPDLVNNLLMKFMRITLRNGWKPSPWLIFGMRMLNVSSGRMLSPDLEYHGRSYQIMELSSKVKFLKVCLFRFGNKKFLLFTGYPQANGQAEVSNKVILDGIKKRLEEAKGKWVEKLPSVLWTHRTTHRRSTGETPFALAYGVEAVIPLEVGFPTIRTTEFNAEQNENNLKKDLNLIEERRDIAAIRLASISVR
uniref:Reverse transcriptase domain-containing protein n=1 Tax=Fagus sylvatica TaxID=28930 RepID=A0A2N9I1G2_FAGSY